MTRIDMTLIQRMSLLPPPLPTVSEAIYRARLMGMKRDTWTTVSLGLRLANPNPNPMKRDTWTTW